jgi:hypothetical protein
VQPVVAVDRNLEEDCRTRVRATDLFRTAQWSLEAQCEKRRLRRRSLSLFSFVEEMEFAMQQHVIKENIDHIKKLLESETDQPTRAMLIRFLADEEAKQHEYLVRHARPLSGIVQ